jgi:GT2 family glycosyltransferase
LINCNLSIIIVSYNTAALLRKAINSVLLSFSKYTFEIIVVDNASKDDSVSVIESEFPKVILIKNSENVGFARANNQAIEIARGEYYLLLNSDAFIVDKNFETIIDLLEKNSIIAAAGPKVLNTDGSLQSKGFCFPSVGKELVELFGFPKFMKPSTLNHFFPNYFWDEDVASQVGWVSGCCILLRGEAVKKVGGLSDDFFLYHEDAEWCYRAHRAGFQIWYYPRVSIIHKIGASTIIYQPKIDKNSSKIYFQKTIGIPKLFIILFIELLSSTISLVFLAVTLRLSKCSCYTRKIKKTVSYIMYLLSSNVKI